MKRVTGTVLLISLITAQLFSFSCQKTDTDGKVSDLAESQTTEAETTDSLQAANEILSGFEKTDYEGREFRITCSRYFNSDIGAQQIPLDEENGELLNDTLYKRDMLLEEYFNIDIVYDCIENETENTIYPTVSKNIMAGDDATDLVWGSMLLVMNPLVSGQMLINMNELPHIDFSQSWWCQSAARDLSFNGDVYFATGDITPREITSAFILAFNKPMFENNKIEAPYDLVREGGWTLDEFNAITKDAYSDLDNDGTKSDGDTYGLVFETMSQYSFYVSSGGATFTPDNNAYPVFSADSEASVELLGSLLDMISKPEYCAPTETYTANTIFRESRSLFLSFACCDLSLLRDMEDDFGLLPNPKYDLSQKEYYSYANLGIATGIGVPVTLPAEEYETVGMLTEAMAALSSVTSFPAQFETILQTKYARDAESIEMLQLATDSIKYDMGYFYGWGPVGTCVEQLLLSGGSIVSSIESIKSPAISQMEKMIEKFES